MTNQTQQQTVTASSRKVGEFIFDVVVNENHTSSLLITENPIESGALIADHAALQPKELTISGIIVEHIPPSVSGALGFQVGVRDSLAFLDSIGFQTGLEEKSREVLAKYNQVQDSFNSFKTAASRALAPWMLGGMNTGQESTAEGNDRISELHEKLLSIQQSGEFLDVQTGTKLYKNMLIQEIKLDQKTDGSATISLTLKEVIVVESKQVSGVSSGNQGGTSGQASGRAGTQSATMADKGRTQPAETKDQSLLSKIGGLM